MDKRIFNCKNSSLENKCEKKLSCCKKQCNNNNILSSLYCVENFLCNIHKASTLYSLYFLLK